jgi:hypothetical protein
MAQVFDLQTHTQLLIGVIGDVVRRHWVCPLVATSPMNWVRPPTHKFAVRRQTCLQHEKEPLDTYFALSCLKYVLGSSGCLRACMVQNLTGPSTHSSGAPLSTIPRKRNLLLTSSK